jgi:hypothetical protein
MKRMGLLCLLLVLAGCGRKDEAASVASVALDSERPWRKPGDKIDSILPMDELLRRFRDSLPEVREFTGGERSRDQLARRFLQALGEGDSTTVAGLLLSKAEFAWLVFPDHLYAREPYALDPDIFWLQLTQETRKGSGRMLQRYGGQPLRYLGLEGCQRDTLQIRQGPDTIWSGCRVHYASRDSTLTRMLFGSVVQREGRYKFLSYHTEF